MKFEREITLAPGLKIPRIITGLWQIADMERGGRTLDPMESAHYLKPYVDNGFYAFDMADHYGSSEIISGVFKNNFQQGGKAKLFTKWVPKPGKISRIEVEEAVDLALVRMQQPTIDLMQFHAWQYAESSWIDALQFLLDMKKKGKIQQIGVTNFDHAHLRIALASGLQIISNQICYSLIDRRAEGEMSALCKEFGIRILAFGTLAGGFLTDKWLGKPEPGSRELKTWSEMKYKRFIDAAGGWEVFQNLLRVVRKIADKHHVSIANIATRYILQNEAVGAVIIGARLSENMHITENKKILEINLDGEDVMNIQTAQSYFHDIPGNCGDEYRKPPFLTASGDLSHHLNNFPPIFTVEESLNGTYKIFSGTTWESLAGFCRAIKSGNQIHISGTTSTHGTTHIGGNDPMAQTHFIIDKIEGVLSSFGASLENVIRTRVYVKNITDWEPVAKAHGERFKAIQPANTLIQANLVGSEYLVEMEAIAVI